MPLNELIATTRALWTTLRSERFSRPADSHVLCNCCCLTRHLNLPSNLFKVFFKLR